MPHLMRILFHSVSKVKKMDLPPFLFLMIKNLIRSQKLLDQGHQINMNKYKSLHQEAIHLNLLHSDFIVMDPIQNHQNHQNPLKKTFCHHLLNNHLLINHLLINLLLNLLLNNVFLLPNLILKETNLIQVKRLISRTFIRGRDI